METLKQVLMCRDGLTDSQAQELIDEAKADLDDTMNDPHFDVDDFMSEWFGLEPDYFIELVDL